MKGFKDVRQRSTDHKIFKNDAGKSIPIPIKKKDMREGTVSGILREIHSGNYEMAEFITNKCKPKKNDDSDIA